MGKTDDYREKLRSLDSWDAFLMQESCLPGPRANLELAFAVALEGTETQLLRYADLDSEAAPKNSREEFLPVCGVIGLGYLAARGGREYFSTIRDRASDPRWRVREAVALGLQKYGQGSLTHLLEMMGEWSKGTLLEKRAVVAVLCELCLLSDRNHAGRSLQIIHEITASILGEKKEDRRSSGC